MFIFMFNYVAPRSCETWHFVPLYVHTFSRMTIKLNLTWLKWSHCIYIVCGRLGTIKSSPNHIPWSKGYDRLSYLPVNIFTCIHLSRHDTSSAWMFPHTTADRVRMEGVITVLLSFALYCNVFLRWRRHEVIWQHCIKSSTTASHNVSLVSLWSACACSCVL